MRQLRIFLTTLFVVASVYYIWSRFEWAQIFAALRTADLGLFFAGSFITILGFWALRALRWSLLLKTVNAAGGSFLGLYLCTACCLALSIVTPAQSGEALKVEMLRKVTGLQRFEGYSCFAIERAFDVLCVLQLGIAAMILGVGHGLGLPVSFLVASCLLVCAATIATAFAATRFGPWKVRVRSMLGIFVASPSRLLLAWLYSMVGWLVVVAGWGCCLAAAGVWLSPSQLMFVTSAVTLVNVLSLVPGGLGVSEVSTVVLLGHFGVPAAMSQAGAILLRAYGVVNLLFGCLHFAAWRLARKQQSDAI
jgi:glycosyltransferase 2 family protein